MGHSVHTESNAIKNTEYGVPRERTIHSPIAKFTPNISQCCRILRSILVPLFGQTLFASHQTLAGPELQLPKPPQMFPGSGTVASTQNIRQAPEAVSQCMCLLNYQRAGLSLFKYWVRSARLMLHVAFLFRLQIAGILCPTASAAGCTQCHAASWV